MTILAIDTSSQFGSAAVRSEGRIVAELRLNGAMQYSEELFAAMEDVIDSAGVSMDAIEIFAAARGPGSFTGLRVGLAAVDGFAFAQRKTAVGISTLSALAWQVGPSDTLIAPMLDARRGEIYGALYRRTQEELVEVRSPAVLKPGQWRDSLPEETIIFCGGGAEAHRLVLEELSGSQIVPTDAHLAATIADMTQVGHREPLEPLYVRPPNAKRPSSR